MSADIERIVVNAVREMRDHVLKSAIAICEMFVAEGGSAAQCVAALKDLAASVPPPPDKMT